MVLPRRLLVALLPVDNAAGSTSSVMGFMSWARCVPAKTTEIDAALVSAKQIEQVHCA